MATNYIQPGDTMEYTAPAGGVTKGVGVMIGAQLVIAIDTAAAGAAFRGKAVGVWSHAKAASQAWTEGQAVYWDNTNKVFSNVATVGFFRAGTAAAAVAGGAGDTTGLVRLSGEPTFAVSATYVQR